MKYSGAAAEYQCLLSNMSTEVMLPFLHDSVLLKLLAVVEERLYQMEHEASVRQRLQSCIVERLGKKSKNLEKHFSEYAGRLRELYWKIDKKYDRKQEGGGEDMPEDGEVANIQERVNKLKVEESKLSEKIVEGKKKMKKINSKTKKLKDELKAFEEQGQMYDQVMKDYESQAKLQEQSIKDSKEKMDKLKSVVKDLSTEKKELESKLLTMRTVGKKLKTKLLKRKNELQEVKSNLDDSALPEKKKKTRRRRSNSVGAVTIWDVREMGGGALQEGNPIESEGSEGSPRVGRSFAFPSSSKDERNIEDLKEIAKNTEKLQTLQKAIKKYDAKIADREKQSKKLKEMCEASQKKLEQLKAETQGMKQTIVDLQQQINDKQKEYAELFAKSHEQRTEYKGFYAEVEGKQADHARLVKEVTALKEQQSSEQNLLVKLKSKNQEYQGLLLRKKNDLKGMVEEQEKKVEEEIKDKRQELNELELKVSNSLTEFAQHQTEMKWVQEKVVGLRSEKLELQSKLKELQQEHKDAQKSVTSLRAKKVLAILDGSDDDSDVKLTDDEEEENVEAGLARSKSLGGTSTPGGDVDLAEDPFQMIMLTPVFTNHDQPIEYSDEELSDLEGVEDQALEIGPAAIKKSSSTLPPHGDLMTKLNEAQYFSEHSDLDMGHIDRHVLDVSHSINVKNLDLITRRLCEGGIEKIEHARAFYRWISENMSFNFQARGRIENNLTPTKVLSSGSATGQGYAILFKDMCDRVGLDCIIIEGLAKFAGTEHPVEHFWNCFCDGKGQWFLCDCCFGAGRVSHRHFLPYVDNFYFMCPPHLFINTHFPHAIDYAFLSPSITKEEFINLPFMTSTFYSMKLAFQSEAVDLRSFQGRAMLEMESFHDDTILVTGKLIDADGSQLHNRLWIEKREKNWSFIAQLPEEGSYDLIISAHPDSKMKRSELMTLATVVRLRCEHGTGWETSPFPKVTNAYYSYGLRLLSPISESLDLVQGVGMCSIMAPEGIETLARLAKESSEVPNSTWLVEEDDSHEWRILVAEPGQYSLIIYVRDSSNGEEDWKRCIEFNATCFEGAGISFPVVNQSAIQSLDVSVLNPLLDLHGEIGLVKLKSRSALEILCVKTQNGIQSQQCDVEVVMNIYHIRMKMEEGEYELKIYARHKTSSENAKCLLKYSGIIDFNQKRSVIKRGSDSEIFV